MSNAWYARYTGDYGRDTAHLSLAEHGAYTLLLDHLYSVRAPIPKEKSAQYRICRANGMRERKAVDSVMRQFFKLQADGYHNARADRELLKQAEVHDRLSRNGRRGAEKKWASTHGPANGPANGPASSPANGVGNGPTMAPGMAYPQPQPQPQEEKTKPLGGDAARALPEADGFDRFYSAYPRKKNKARARKAWCSRVKPEEVDMVLAKLEIFKLGEWNGKDPQYIPHPASWINDRRWEDEIDRKHPGSAGAITAPAGKYDGRKSDAYRN